MRPDASLPFGSAPNALALSRDGKTLSVANGGNNAVAVLALTGPADKPASLKGFMPAGWYPGAVVVRRKAPLHRQRQGRGLAARNSRRGSASTASPAR